MSNNSFNIGNNWNKDDLVKKEARGMYGIVDFGEVQEVTNEYIATEKGTIEEERYYFPLNLVDYFDGATIYFKLTKEEANKYKKGYFSIDHKQIFIFYSFLLFLILQNISLSS